MPTGGCRFKHWVLKNVQGFGQNSIGVGKAAYLRCCSTTPGFDCPGVYLAPVAHSWPLGAVNNAFPPPLSL